MRSSSPSSVPETHNSTNRRQLSQEELLQQPGREHCTPLHPTRIGLDVILSPDMLISKAILQIFKSQLEKTNGYTIANNGCDSALWSLVEGNAHKQKNKMVQDKVAEECLAAIEEDRQTQLTQLSQAGSNAEDLPRDDMNLIFEVGRLPELDQATSCSSYNPTHLEEEIERLNEQLNEERAERERKDNENKDFRARMKAFLETAYMGQDF
ncbi:unnamed protein product [Arabis nemorensis]|uniref:Uncharacterized protein n=1 Tax=Arabis nemorensis TaxID=586526 RepID=A0A565BK26_9BRAS|nr:unnamed protein product [Arabis nemorensis]